eukprot:gene11710-biopygen7276
MVGGKRRAAPLRKDARPPKSDGVLGKGGNEAPEVGWARETKTYSERRRGAAGGGGAARPARRRGAAGAMSPITGRCTPCDQRTSCGNYVRAGQYHTKYRNSVPDPHRLQIVYVGVHPGRLSVPGMCATLQRRQEDPRIPQHQGAGQLGPPALQEELVHRWQGHSAAHVAALQPEPREAAQVAAEAFPRTAQGREDPRADRSRAVLSVHASLLSTQELIHVPGVSEAQVTVVREQVANLGLGTLPGCRGTTPYEHISHNRIFLSFREDPRDFCFSMGGESRFLVDGRGQVGNGVVPAVTRKHGAGLRVVGVRHERRTAGVPARIPRVTGWRNVPAARSPAPCTPPHGPASHHAPISADTDRDIEALADCNAEVLVRDYGPGIERRSRQPIGGQRASALRRGTMQDCEGTGFGVKRLLPQHKFASKHGAGELLLALGALSPQRVSGREAEHVEGGGTDAKLNVEAIQGAAELPVEGVTSRSPRVPSDVEVWDDVPVGGPNVGEAL